MKDMPSGTIKISASLKDIPTHILVEELRGREDVKVIEMFCEGPAEIKFQGPTTILEVKG